MIRLHCRIALVEGGDEYVLMELLADERLRRFIAHRLSDRAALADHRRLDALLDALAKAGHTPQVIEDHA